MAQERKVPVLQSNNSLIEQEFDSQREKFELEIRKLDEEMSKYRSQVMRSEKDRVFSSQSTSSRSTTISSSGQSESVEQQQQSLPKRTISSKHNTFNSISKTSFKPSIEKMEEKMRNLNEQSDLFWEQKSKYPTNWLQDPDSPLIKDAQNGEKVLRLRFDVADYKPEEIVVKTIDNWLKIHAKSEITSNNMSAYREYNREFLLPDGIDLESIKSSLSVDGVLTVEAPLPPKADQ